MASAVLREISEGRCFKDIKDVGHVARGIAHEMNNLLTTILGSCEFLLEDMSPQDQRRSDVEAIKKAGERGAVLSRQLQAKDQPPDAHEGRPRRAAEHAVRERAQQSVLELASACEATLEGWVRALDLRDHETEGHSQRVTDLTVRLAHRMGLSDVECLHIHRGALLHDIGKMGVPDSILHKPSALNAEEWKIMRRHPGYALDMLAPIGYLEPALEIPYCHHERWDGTGYPRGLHGENIPLAARMFAAVDIWDAIRSDRPYRAAWSVDKARDHLLSLAGNHLDPSIVQMFLDMITSIANAQSTKVSRVKRIGTILVVDDDAATASLFTRWLARDGYEVMTAASGDEALVLAADRRPDLVLLDIDIPAPDGLTVCQRLKDDPLTSGIPVILISGFESTYQAGGKDDGGAADHLVKPVDAYELKARLRAVLEQTRCQDLLRGSN